jgi:O-antigen/teichoic acid export membrane protein
VLVVIVLAAAGPIDSRVFHDDPVLLAALMLGLAMFFTQYLARGTLAGNQRFRPYGLLLATEGVLRMIICAVLGVLGVATAGPYGLALVAGSVIAVAVAVTGRRGLLRPGPPAAWSELSNALGFLLLASVVTQFLLSIGTVAVQLLATPSQQAAAGRFLTSRIIAYIPIFLLQAMQAALLPKLSGLAAAGRHIEFRKMLLELLLLVIVLGGLAVAAITALGPLATRLLFGSGFELGTLDFALLSASCAGFMIAQVLNQALISLTGYARVAAAWVSGGVAFVVVTALGSQLFLRVELGLLVGAIVTVVVMVVLLAPLLGARAATAGGEDLLAASVPIPEI